MSHKIVKSSRPPFTAPTGWRSLYARNTLDGIRKLASDGDVSSTKVIKNLDAEYVSPSFMAFARERAQMIYDNGGWRNWRKYCGLINKRDAFRKKRRMADITVDDLTVDLFQQIPEKVFGEQMLLRLYQNVCVKSSRALRVSLQQA